LNIANPITLPIVDMNTADQSSTIKSTKDKSIAHWSLQLFLSMLTLLDYS